MMEISVATVNDENEIMSMEIMELEDEVLSTERKLDIEEIFNSNNGRRNFVLSGLISKKAIYLFSNNDDPDNVKTIYNEEDNTVESMSLTGLKYFSPIDYNE